MDKKYYYVLEEKKVLFERTSFTSDIELTQEQIDSIENVEMNIFDIDGDAEFLDSDMDWDEYKCNVVKEL